MVDAHILIGDEPIEWRNEALNDIAALPVTLHKLKAITGQLAGARINGWTVGASEYITWFDPDDRYPSVAAAAFIHAAVDKMQRDTRLACCYSTEQRVDASLNHVGRVHDQPYSKAMMLTHPSWIHGLVIMKRSCVLEHAHKIDHSKPHPEWQLYKLLARSRLGFLRLPYVARLWRQHAHNAHKIHNQINVIKSYSKALIEHP